MPPELHNRAADNWRVVLNLPLPTTSSVAPMVLAMTSSHGQPPSRSTPTCSMRTRRRCAHRYSLCFRLAGHRSHHQRRSHRRPARARFALARLARRQGRPSAAQAELERVNVPAVAARCEEVPGGCGHAAPRTPSGLGDAIPKPPTPMSPAIRFQVQGRPIRRPWKTGSDCSRQRLEARRCVLAQPQTSSGPGDCRANHKNDPTASSFHF